MLERFDFFLQAVFLDRILDGQLKRFFFERLGQVIGRPDLHRFDNSFGLTDAGKNDDGHRRVDRFHARKHFDTVLVGQHDVQQDHRW